MKKIIVALFFTLPLLLGGLSAKDSKDQPNIDKKKAFTLEYSSRYGLYTSRNAVLDTRLEGLKYMVDLNDAFVTTPNYTWAAETGMNPSRYFEISIKPKKNIFISELYYRLTGNSTSRMQFSVLWSLDKNFANPETYSSKETLFPQSRAYSQSPMLKLSKGKMYYLRIYPWSVDGGENLTIRIDNIVFKCNEVK